RVQPHVAMADLLSRAVGQTRGARSISRNLPEIELVVKNHGLVVLGPTGNAESGLLLDGHIRLAVDKRGWHVLRDVDYRPRGGVHGPIMIVLQIEKITPVWARLEIAIFGQ